MENLVQNPSHDFPPDADLVLGAYITGKPHPQHDWSIPANSFEYFADWFHSAKRVGLNAVILHNQLKDSFVQRYEEFYRFENPYPAHQSSLKFVRVPDHEYSGADARFFHALEFLQQTPCRSAFIVDISDAWFHSPPARLACRRSLWDYLDVESFRRVRNGGDFLQALRTQWNTWRRRHAIKYFIGAERFTIGESKWMRNHLEHVYGRPFPELLELPDMEEKIILNCGVLGGRRDDVLELLRLVRREFEHLGHTDMLMDMAVFNKILHALPPEHIYYNGRLNSPFKQYLKSGFHAVFHK